MSRIIYTGVFLNQENKEELNQIAKNWIDKMSSERNMVFNNVKFYSDHMTCQFKNDFTQHEMETFVASYKGTPVEMIVRGFGYSDKALCAIVDCNVPSSNKLKHITMATFNGGKPVDSNNVTNIENLNTTFTINGMVNSYVGN